MHVFVLVKLFHQSAIKTLNLTKPRTILHTDKKCCNIQLKLLIT